MQWISSLLISTAVLTTLMPPHGFSQDNGWGSPTLQTPSTHHYSTSNICLLWVLCAYCFFALYGSCPAPPNLPPNKPKAFRSTPHEQRLAGHISTSAK